MAQPEPVDESLWGLHKKWEGIDPGTPLPASLDAIRAARSDDGIAHCGTCGGEWFTSTVRYAADGTPARVLTPQTCVGCGALRQARWPS